MEYLPIFCHNIAASEKESSILIVRSNINNVDECNRWISEFGQNSETSWIVSKSAQDSDRMVLHKYWRCQRNNRNKNRFSTKRDSRGTDCHAAIDIKIKKVNWSTKRGDPYLKLSPPLPAVIKLKLDHNHATDSLDSLRCLRLRDEVRAEFESYFNDGLTPAAAIRAHENKLLSGVDGYTALANASLNPTGRTVYNLYDKWRIKNQASLSSPVQMLESKLHSRLKRGLSGEIQSEPKLKPGLVNLFHTELNSCEEIRAQLHCVYPLDKLTGISSQLKDYPQKVFVEPSLILLAHSSSELYAANGSSTCSQEFISFYKNTTNHQLGVKERSAESDCVIEQVCQAVVSNNETSDDVIDVTDEKSYPLEEISADSDCLIEQICEAVVSDNETSDAVIDLTDEKINSLIGVMVTNKPSPSMTRLNGCHACRRGFSSLQRFKRHIKHIHVNEKQYGCTQCEHSFRVKSGLTRHIKAKHAVTRYDCDRCDFSTKYSQWLKFHIFSVHLENGPHMCPQCNLGFSEKKSLTLHLGDVHNHEKTLEDSSCGSKFATHQGYDLNWESAHCGEKCYSCDQCNYRCSEKNTLRQHQIIDHYRAKRFLCAQCGFKTFYKGSFNIHCLAVHQKLKPSTCSECGKTFFRRGDLQRHTATVHRGFRRYSCSYCDVKFSKKLSLQRHIDSVHQEEISP